MRIKGESILLRIKIDKTQFFGLVVLGLISLSSYAEEKPIKLQSNFIGDKEQPLVSYFIPWKDIGTPDKLKWNLDSSYDKTLGLVDRKVLLRSVSMYNEMKLERISSNKNGEL